MFRCTKDTPWSEEIVERPVEHVDAHEIGDQENGWPGGDIVTNYCPNCGHKWKEELPQ